MLERPKESAVTAEHLPRCERDARSGGRRWARPLRRLLLCLIGLLYAASIPWYRGDATPDRIFGLPDWVAVSILCYSMAAILNSAAWLLTDIAESAADDETPRP